MSTLTQLQTSTIFDEIANHLAWQGKISGQKADQMLRNKTIPYLYILRAGELESENQKDYYVSFVGSDLSVKHTPFIVWINDDGLWSYLNGGAGGLYKASTSIDDVLYKIMHAHSKDTPQPLFS